MPKIASIDITAMEYAISPDLAYGTSRGLNFKRSSALISVTTDEGIVGYGEGLGLTLDMEKVEKYRIRE